MISEKVVPKNRGFFSLRSGSKNGCLILSLFFVRSCLERTSLRSRFASFWVDLFSFLFRPSQRHRFAIVSRFTWGSSLEFHFSITRVCVSYHPLRFCEPLFFSVVALPHFFPPFGFALRVESTKTLHPQGEGVCFDGRSIHFLNSRGDENTAGIVVFWFFIFFHHHLFCRGRKIFNFSGRVPHPPRRW